MITLPVKLMPNNNVSVVLMITLTVKLMAKQQCMHCIYANSASETDGQTTMYPLY